MPCAECSEHEPRPRWLRAPDTIPRGTERMSFCSRTGSWYFFCQECIDMVEGDEDNEWYYTEESATALLWRHYFFMKTRPARQCPGPKGEGRSCLVTSTTHPARVAKPKSAKSVRFSDINHASSSGSTMARESISDLPCLDIAGQGYGHGEMA